MCFQKNYLQSHLCQLFLNRNQEMDRDDQTLYTEPCLQKNSAFLQIRAAIQFPAIHLSFPKDSSNKHLQLCKQNAFSKSFVKQSVPSEDIKESLPTKAKPSSLQTPVRGLRYSRQFSSNTLVSVSHLQQLRKQLISLSWIEFLRTKMQVMCKAYFG